jgi:hypothetical protein
MSMFGHPDAPALGAEDWGEVRRGGGGGRGRGREEGQERQTRERVVLVEYGDSSKSSTQACPWRELFRWLTSGDRVGVGCREIAEDVPLQSLPFDQVCLPDRKAAALVAKDPGDHAMMKTLLVLASRSRVLSAAGPRSRAAAPCMGLANDAMLSRCEDLDSGGTTRLVAQTTGPRARSCAVRV